MRTYAYRFLTENVGPQERAPEMLLCWTQEFEVQVQELKVSLHEKVTPVLGKSGVRGCYESWLLEDVRMFGRSENDRYSYCMCG